MPVKRRIDKRRDIAISERAVELFREMKSLGRRCTCEPPPEGQWWGARQCRACARWGQLQGELHHELKLKPWCWPAIRPTLRECMERPWNGVQGLVSQHSLWQALDQAAKAAKAAHMARPVEESVADGEVRDHEAAQAERRSADATRSFAVRSG